MRRLLVHLLARPVELWFAAAIIGVAGGYGLLHVSVDLFPNLDIPVVNIVTHAPELSSADIDLLVTRPIEDALRGAAGMARVASSSQQGISIVTAQLTWGTGVEAARQTAMAAIAQVAPRLPTGATPRIEQIGTTLQQVGGWAVTSADDPVELASLVRREIAPRLMGVDGVALVEVLGGERPALWVDVEPARLVTLGLGVDDLMSAIQRAHRSQAVGFVERSSEDLVVRADSLVHGAADLASVPVGLPDGQSVRLDAIASVHEGRAPRHSEVRLDDRPAVSLMVRKQPGASTIAVVDGVRRELARLRDGLPVGSEVRQFFDQSEVLRAARSTIVHELLLGAGLAIAVLWLLLGEMRPTIAVATTIPLALLATTAVLWWLGEGLNVVTLAALTLAVGMVVDDAIVVAENIFRHREQGARPSQAALEGSLEVAGPDASGTLTTVAAYAPLLMVGGLASVFLRPFGITVSLALIASLVLALTAVPVLLGGGKGGPPSARRSFGSRIVATVADRLVRLVAVTLQHRRATLGVAALTTLALCASLGLRHGVVSLLPPVDEGALLVEYVLPPGVSLTESQRVASAITAVARTLPGVTTVESRVGAPAGGAEVEGVNRGELLVKLAPLGERRLGATELLHELRDRAASIEGVVLLLHQPTQEKMDESFSGLPAVFGVTVFGSDQKAIEEAAAHISAMLRVDPAVTSVVDNSRFHQPELVMHLDGERCAATGIDPASVRTTLAAAVWGAEVAEIVRDREPVDIRIRLADGPRSIGDLGAVPLRAQDGSIVPMSAVADLRVDRVEPEITRLDGRRELTILAEVEGNLMRQATRIQQRVDDLRLPKGVEAEVGGQYRALVGTIRDLLLVLVVAAVLILAIMTVQLGNLRLAAWILAVVPAGLAGAAGGLALTASGLNLAVAAGLLTLLGIGVNNGIVLVDFATREVSAGADVETAVAGAVRARLRPVMATSLTTVAALLPTALGLGAGEHVFQPFAVTVISGLVAGTFATLIVLPAAVSRSLAPTGSE